MIVHFRLLLSDGREEDGAKRGWGKVKELFIISFARWGVTVN